MGFLYSPDMLKVNPEFYPSWTGGTSSSTSLVGGASASAGSGFSGADAMGVMSVVSSIAGAIQAGIGTYYMQDALERNLKHQQVMLMFNKRMSDLNVQQAERSAQSILQAGQHEQVAVSMKAGKIKGAQRASQGARGIQMGVGNAAEEIATTDIMKEIDRLTINANSVRAAWGVRMQGINAGTQSVNYANAALAAGASAEGISPFMSMTTSLLNSGAQVASAWYGRSQSNRLANLFEGVS